MESSIREVELLIYEQATRNYAQYLVRCQRREEEAKEESERVRKELISMSKRLERAYGYPVTVV